VKRTIPGTLALCWPPTAAHRLALRLVPVALVKNGKVEIRDMSGRPIVQ
jgi:hypothetical protein